VGACPVAATALDRPPDFSQCEYCGLRCITASRCSRARSSICLDLTTPASKEIIIISDGSTDGTVELLARQHHPRLTTVILDEHSGKAVAVNAGVAKATADVILFVDIRPEIAPGAIQQLVNNFADPKVGCVAGELILRTESHDDASRLSADSTGVMKSGSGHVSRFAAHQSAFMAASNAISPRALRAAARRNDSR